MRITYVLVLNRFILRHFQSFWAFLLLFPFGWLNVFPKLCAFYTFGDLEYIYVFAVSLICGFTPLCLNWLYLLFMFSLLLLWKIEVRGLQLVQDLRRLDERWAYLAFVAIIIQNRWDGPRLLWSKCWHWLLLELMRIVELWLALMVAHSSQVHDIFGALFEILLILVL